MNKKVFLIFPDGEKVLCCEEHLPLARSIESYFKEIPDKEKLKWWRNKQAIEDD